MIRTLAICTLALCTPSKGLTQEAYLTQISTSVGSVSVPVQKRALAPKDLINEFAMPAPKPVMFTSDLGQFGLIGNAGGREAVARTSVVGNDNSAMIMQSGIHAASLTQVGNANAGQIIQAGFGNQASIHQLSSGNVASITQHGGNNQALTIQR